jgi:DNA-binding Xre family transcriptional regulator
MITSRLRRVAKRKHGIRNAYQFQKLTGFSPAMAYSLWEDDWQRVHLTTLDTLCHILECTPNDLLEFKRDPESNFAMVYS